MGKRLMLILACALIVGIALPAYAEVQNIKVSGDILVQGISRGRFDLTNFSDTAQVVHNADSESQSSLLSTVRIRLDADLTENVQAVVRLLNEREWSEETNASTDIDLDLAYITMKEFFYSPLTMIIGRQNLRYGNAFVIGDPDTNQFGEFNHYSGVQADTVAPEDLSSRKAFDAFRAILDYDPLVIDLIWSKVDEATVLGTGTTTETDDVDLYGINAAYDWAGSKNIKQDAYIFVKDVSGDGGTGGRASVTVQSVDEPDVTYTVGTLVSLNPIERFFLSGEFGYQFGKKYLWNDGDSDGVIDAGEDTFLRNRSAFAYQIIAQYALDMKYNPVLTTVFTHYDGDKDPGGTDPERGAFHGWDPMFEDQAGGKIFNALFSATNQDILELKGNLTPIEDLTVSLEYAYLWLVEPLNNRQVAWTPNDYATYTMVPGEQNFGQEVDLLLTYDYTEDVQFGLNGGLFIPGQAFRYDNREIAHQVIGSVKVTF